MYLAASSSVHCLLVASAYARHVSGPGAAAEKMAALVADFPEYDEELLKCMLEDQSGDVLETRAVLRVRLHFHCKRVLYRQTVRPPASPWM